MIFFENRKQHSIQANSPRFVGLLAPSFQLAQTTPRPIEPTQEQACSDEKPKQNWDPGQTDREERFKVA